MEDSVIPGSAESIAISLLRKFSEKHLPKASELKWLVSEHDAPQSVSINHCPKRCYLFSADNGLSVYLSVQSILTT